MVDQETPDTSRLFDPFQLKSLTLRNRIVMPPMGVHKDDQGVPGADVVQYYRRRAEGGAGLILTEGTYIDHPVSGNNPGYLRINSEASIAGWAEVVRQVHEAGGLIMPELWHVGLVYLTEQLIAGGELTYDTSLGMVGPSGYIMPGEKVTEEMTRRQMRDVIESFARAAVHSKLIGFDGVELHGAHGYLIDQFFWDAMNRREDEYGGSMRNRARFGAEVVAEVRQKVGPEYPILMRISQWKMQDYNAKVAKDPRELEEWLDVLVEAGVDAFDCSQRRYWEPEFPGSPLNFAGWVKKITGKPVITVGSVGLNIEMLASIMKGQSAQATSLGPLMDMFNRGDFDLVAVGRSLIADAEWPNKVAAGQLSKTVPFRLEHLPRHGG
jgi:2,4-dienoyl-CoA reductase-like NADH-dependent reductase (Old Yellow Enzyme family)